MSDSPYVELDRDAWAALAENAPQPLTEAEVARLRGLRIAEFRAKPV